MAVGTGLDATQDCKPGRLIARSHLCAAHHSFHDPLAWSNPQREFCTLAQNSASLTSELRAASLSLRHCMHRVALLTARAEWTGPVAGDAVATGCRQRGYSQAL